MPKIAPKECPNCAMTFAPIHDKCPACGYEYPKQPMWITIMAILLVIAFLLVYIL
jgi:uncharacterized OB-fold protein